MEGEEAEQPTAERALHQRLLARDPTAPADVVAVYLDSLTCWLTRQFSREDPHLVETMVIDLLLNLAQHPEHYDPDRLALLAYLRMAARRDMQNAQASARRRASHLTVLEDVEKAQRAGNIGVEVPPDLADEVIRREPLPPALANALVDGFHPVEQQCIQLIVDGERRTAPYAELLGLMGLPAAKRAREVKRVKDRLKKQLKRRLAGRAPRDA